jgi:hypothetical protein
VGNHELPGAGSEPFFGASMEWLRAYEKDPNGTEIAPDIVNSGPSGCVETTYSFDYENAHFVVLNEYCDTQGDHVTDGDIPDHLYNWLANDLEQSTKEHIFIFGHEPAYPQPDADNGREHHMYDSLNKYPTNRDRFWNLLKVKGAKAYFCGHTHNCSVVQVDGVWQLDSGHARGLGDTGAPSTFLMVHVNGSTVSYMAYRDIHDGDYDYNDIVHRVTFLDVPLGYWAEDSIHAIFDAGITTGCSQNPIKYCTFDPVTRAQMAAFIVRAAEGEPPANYCDTGSPFSDVSPDTWPCKYIKRLLELGITKGCGPGIYCPDRNVTRAEMAAFIVRAVEGEPSADYCDTGSPFSDVSANTWPCKYIKRLLELEITTGCGPGFYCPDRNVTRAEMAAFLGRTFLGMD